MNANLIKCPCNNCSAHVEFETEQAGQTIACPHCGLDTILFLPRTEKPKPAAAQPTPKNSNLKPCPFCDHQVSITAPTCPQCGGVLFRQKSGVKGSTIACSYVLSLLMPPVGFFVGIYLAAKKEIGHGVSVIAISLFVNSLIYWAFLIAS